jgi:hypothetical protein
MILKAILMTYAICQIETGWVNISNQDDGGSPSYGVCQVKLNTALQMDPKATVDKLLVIEYNYHIALKYYQYQLKRYKGDIRCAISAYNAGSCITNNQKRYVDKVIKFRKEMKR